MAKEKKNPNQNLEVKIRVSDIFGTDDADTLFLTKNDQTPRGVVILELFSTDKGRLATVVNVKDLERALRLMNGFDYGS